MTLETIRYGVSFRSNAAASFRRIEAQRGPTQVTRSTVPYEEQEKLYNEWLAGMHPEIPVVLDPDESVHVYRENDPNSGVAVDSDARGAFWDDNGWKIVNPKELWHREYREAYDNHLFDNITEKEVESMQTLEVWTCPAWEAAGQRVVTNGSACQTYPAGWAQALVNAGAKYTNFGRPDASGNNTNNNGNSDMQFAVGVVWELNGMSTGEITRKLDELIAKAGADVEVISFGS